MHAMHDLTLTLLCLWLLSVALGLLGGGVRWRPGKWEPPKALHCNTNLTHTTMKNFNRLLFVSLLNV